MKPTEEATRLDKWLWSVRLYKTRTLAADACRLGRVTMNDQEAKPSRSVKVGDVYHVKTQDMTRTVRVLSLLDRRVGAKLVSDFLEDLTPESEREAAKARRENFFNAPPIQPLLKPSKRDRRILAEFFNPEEQ